MAVASEGANTPPPAAKPIAADEKVNPGQDKEKIQEELKQIIARTQQLQVQVKDNRSEIQKILKRAEIHQKILKGITIPSTIQTKQQIDAEQIIAQEKMRLIALQAHETQEQLKVFQNARAVPPQSNSSVKKTTQS